MISRQFSLSPLGPAPRPCLYATTSATLITKLALTHQFSLRFVCVSFFKRLCGLLWSSSVLGKVEYLRTMSPKELIIWHSLISYLQGLFNSGQPIAWQIILAISSSSSSSSAFSRGSPRQESEREHVSGGSHQPGNPSSPHKEYPLSWPRPIFLSLSRRVCLERLPSSALSSSLGTLTFTFLSFRRYLLCWWKLYINKIFFDILLFKRTDAKALERMYYCLAYFDDGDVIQWCQPFRQVRQGRA